MCDHRPRFEPERRTMCQQQGISRVPDNQKLSQLETAIFFAALSRSLLLPNSREARVRLIEQSKALSRANS